jgi:lipopolysaccharide export LptBFGC system permease protein LptF
MRRSALMVTIVSLAIVFGLQSGPECSAQAKKESSQETKTKTGFEVLEGRWLRPDGGYIIQIRSVDAGGKMMAGYFNPRPINVSKAQASKEGGKIKVFVELSDVGYPGSTYTLTYDPKEDVLRGIYYQAAMKQNFDVYFTRMK